jgi:hypothetical protein
MQYIHITTVQATTTYIRAFLKYIFFVQYINIRIHISGCSVSHLL